jgi:polysaccharide biosynthesis protein VpsQ
MLLRLAFILFTSAFVSLVVLADRGQIGQIWEFIALVPFGDKLGHLGLVGTLTVLMNLQLKRRKADPLMLGSLIVLTGMMLEEGSQYFIPARSFDGYDALANLVGVLCGEGLVRMLPRRITRRDQPLLPPAAEAPASCGAP